ncbi:MULTISPECIES: LysR substrate-binding domain-containing protein [Thiomicrorhabdus]|uniref:LysR family transcriptional regulator n=1 Tax=Thiomicrorhabdus heinhorstiae TaxID=2748010 RepID=A0ABS0BXT9_9GAMM|nr:MULTISPECIES: LysR substrate-binding domain-containing protein [Thiomicrorhabdus]MBF6057666.1 LysR family transcriptional regulator [Thiomicrorhabdus heinhorstiae]
MNLTQIKLLIELNKTNLNLSLASQNLHIVQSAGSRQLKLLEDELGFPLFVRHSKKLISFTLAGEQVLEQAKVICLAQKNIRTISDAIKEPDKGCIRLGTTHTQARYILPHVLSIFKRNHPKTKFHIEESFPENLFTMLRKDIIDIAICSEVLASKEELEAISGYQWSHLLVAPPTHPVWNTDLSLKSLLDFPILSYRKGFSHSDKVSHALKQIDPEFEFEIVASDADVIKTYVRQGFGIGIIAQMALEESDKPYLKSHHLTEELGHSTTYCAYLKKRILAPYQQTFVDSFLSVKI